MELKIEHLSKRFKDKTAVDDVSLTLTSGVWGVARCKWSRKNNPYENDCRYYDAN